MLPVASYSSSHSCPSGCRTQPQRHGSFKRKSDGVRVCRFRCPACGSTRSEATGTICYWQKRRDINTEIFRLLTGGFSQRRAALHLEVDRKTVVRKFILLGQTALPLLALTNLALPKVKIMEFDDLETFEHSKCKPLSVTLAVESETRRLLGFRVSQMPAKGLLTQVALRKYGYRADKRKAGRQSLFKEIQPLLEKGALIKSDMNPHYTPDVKEHFPESLHVTYKGRRGCVVGMGELKALGFDPLFSLNHTCAMLRANINRLFRRTWCTTKVPERLSYHIAIYSLFHNLVLIQKKKQKSPKIRDINPLQLLLA